MSNDAEKVAEEGRPRDSADHPQKPPLAGAQHQDEALKVLGTYTGDPEWAEDEEKIIRRRLDWRLMPVLCVTYGLQHYDKTMLSQAAIFGLRDDLGLLEGDRYSFSASIFYLGFIAGAYPLMALAQRFPLERVASLIVTTWGLCLILTVVCFDFRTLYTQRFFLGFLESGIGPVFMVIVVSLEFTGDKKLSVTETNSELREDSTRRKSKLCAWGTFGPATS